MSTPNASFSSRSLTLLLALLCIVSGFCGLSYQIIWHGLFANLMGSGALASTLVISLFLTGLAIGYERGAKQARIASGTQLFKLAAIYEGVIGFWAALLAGTLPVLPSLAAAMIGSTNTNLIDLLVAALLVLLPTICMGAAFPLIVEILARSNPNPGRAHAILYSSNTLGAIIGCLITGLVIIPSYGMRSALVVFAILSSSIAVALLMLSRPIVSAAPQLSKDAHEPQRTILPASALIGATLAGVAVFMWETIELRLFGLAAGPSHYLFALITATFILISSLTGFAISRLSAGITPRISRFLLLTIGCSTLWLYVMVLNAPRLPYFIYQLRILFPSTTDGWIGYHAALFALMVALNALLLAPLSMIVPLLICRFAQTDSTGFITGTLWRWNSFGCVLGACIGGYIGFYIASLEQLAKTAATISILAIIFLSLSFPIKRAALHLAVLLIIPLWITPVWDQLRTSIGIYYLRERDEYSDIAEKALYPVTLKDAQILAAKDDLHGRVAVAQFGANDSPNPERVLYIDGKPEGNTRGDYISMSMAGHIPMLFSKPSSDRTTPARAAVIGFGVGMSVGALTVYDHISHIDVMEISQAVKDFAPYFDGGNHAISKQPNIDWIIDDAYRTLMRSTDTYAVIAAQPSSPWMPGIDRIYSVEFYRTIKNALKADGIYGHWVPLYETSADTARLAFRTLAEVFPSVRAFQFGADLIVLASPTAGSLDHVTQPIVNMLLPRVKKDLTKIGIRSIEDLLAREVWLPLPLSEVGPGNSMFQNRIGHLAGKDFFFGRTMEVSEFVRTRADLKALVKQSKSSLLVQALDAGIIAKDWPKLIKVTCGDTHIKLIEPSWRLVRSPCRDSLVAAMVAGDIEAPPAARAVIGEAQNWISEETAAEDVSTLTVEQVMREAEMFVELYSGMLPLKSEKLRSRLAWCESLRSKEGHSRQGAACAHVIEDVLSFIQ